nr:hypothetical protein [Atlantibacter hermannii]
MILWHQQYACCAQLQALSEMKKREVQVRHILFFASIPGTAGWLNGST